MVGNIKKQKSTQSLKRHKMKNNDEHEKSTSKNLVCSEMKYIHNYGKLTLEELRKCEGFNDVSELEGLEIIESIYKLSFIVYNF